MRVDGRAGERWNVVEVLGGWQGSSSPGWSGVVSRMGGR